MSSSSSKPPKMTPYRTMRGHTKRVRDVVHLPDRRIITCSDDGSLRLWDLENGIQIGNDWRDGVDENGLLAIALSPNGNTVASGSADGMVRLWNVKMGKVIVRWKGHTLRVVSVCWSAGGERVVSGSLDGTARVWDAKSGDTVLGPIKTGHMWVLAVIFSPDSTQFATAGFEVSENSVKIWDAKTGELFTTLKYSPWVLSLAWTSDGKKLISTSIGPIRIFDTATWQQIATLEGNSVQAITLSQNNRLLASVSHETVHLWNLDTNLPVKPPLQHEGVLECAALSADGKVLVTGGDNNVHAWDIQAILKKAGLEDLLLPVPHVPAPKPPVNKNDIRRQPIHTGRIPPGFFDGGNISSSTSHGVHHRSSSHVFTPSIKSARAFFSRIPSLFHRPHSHTNEATELQHTPKQGFFSRHSPPTVEVAAVQDKKALAVAPQLAKRTQQQQQTQTHGQGSSSQSQPGTTSVPTTQPVPQTNGPSQATAPGVVTIQSRILTLLARLVLLICCAPLPSTDGH